MGLSIKGGAGSDSGRPDMRCRRAGACAALAQSLLPPGQESRRHPDLEVSGSPGMSLAAPGLPAAHRLARLAADVVAARMPDRSRSISCALRLGQAADPRQPDLAHLFRQAGCRTARSSCCRSRRSRRRPSFCRPAATSCIAVSGRPAPPSRSTLRSETVREVVDIPAGGIRIEGRVGDVRIPQGQIYVRHLQGQPVRAGRQAAAHDRHHDRRRDDGAGRHLHDRLELRRRQFGGALRHPRPDRTTDRRDGDAPRRHHHAQAARLEPAAMRSPTPPGRC